MVFRLDFSDERESTFHGEGLVKNQQFVSLWRIQYNYRVIETHTIAIKMECQALLFLVCHQLLRQFETRLGCLLQSIENQIKRLLKILLRPSTMTLGTNIKRMFSFVVVVVLK